MIVTLEFGTASSSSPSKLSSSPCSTAAGTPRKQQSTRKRPRFPSEEDELFDESPGRAVDPESSAGKRRLHTVTINSVGVGDAGGGEGGSVEALGLRSAKRARSNGQDSGDENAVISNGSRGSQQPEACGWWSPEWAFDDKRWALEIGSRFSSRGEIIGKEVQVGAMFAVPCDSCRGDRRSSCVRRLISRGPSPQCTNCAEGNKRCSRSWAVDLARKYRRARNLPWSDGPADSSKIEYQEAPAGEEAGSALRSSAFFTPISRAREPALPGSSPVGVPRHGPSNGELTAPESPARVGANSGVTQQYRHQLRRISQAARSQELGAFRAQAHHHLQACAAQNGLDPVGISDLKTVQVLVNKTGDDPAPLIGELSKMRQRNSGRLAGLEHEHFEASRELEMLEMACERLRSTIDNLDESLDERKRLDVFYTDMEQKLKGTAAL